MDDNTAMDDNAAMDVLTLYKKKKKKQRKEEKTKTEIPGQARG
jgi:hypothetical protein